MYTLNPKKETLEMRNVTGNPKPVNAAPISLTPTKVQP